MSSKTSSVVITGASGLLGRSLMKVFAEGRAWNKVTGTAFSRSGENLVKLDLNDLPGVAEFVRKERPDFLVHSAAQRFPDKVEKDLEAAKRLNVEATEALAKSLNEYGGRMLYISTDYVFDGVSPPFTVDSPTNPLNTYGQLKLDGEKAALAVNPENIVLRIPVLYGDVEYLGESAVTTLLHLLIQDDSKTTEEEQHPNKLEKMKKEVSDYEIRRPSHVVDIANVVQDILLKSFQNNVKGIYQWCGSEPMTKYGMVQVMAEVFDKNMEHVLGNSEKPQGGGTTRPHDTTMDRSRLEKLGISHHTKFRDGIRSALTKWI